MIDSLHPGHGCRDECPGEVAAGLQVCIVVCAYCRRSCGSTNYRVVQTRTVPCKGPRMWSSGADPAPHRITLVLASTAHDNSLATVAT